MGSSGRTAAVAALAGVLLGGCVGPLVPVTKIDETEAAQLASMPVFEPDRTPTNALHRWTSSTSSRWTVSSEKPLA